MVTPPDTLPNAQSVAGAAAISGSTALAGRAEVAGRAGRARSLADHFHRAFPRERQTGYHPRPYAP